MLTLPELRRLHGEIEAERIETIKRWAGLQTRAEVDAQADQLIAELGEPLVDDRADPRRVVVAWPDRTVYARVCCPVLDLWKPHSQEALDELEAAWVWGDPKRVIQLDADEDAVDPTLGDSPQEREPEPVEQPEAPVEPVFGPGPYGPLEQPTVDQRELVEAIAANANRDRVVLLKSLVAMKPTKAASGEPCKRCDQEIHAGGVQAHDDPPEFWHRDCAAEQLAELEEADEQAAELEALEQATAQIELNPVLIDRARKAYAEGNYKASHNPERLKKGEPIGDPACFACWRPIKRGDLAGRATKSSKKPMHWSCVEQVIEKAGPALTEGEAA